MRRLSAFRGKLYDKVIVGMTAAWYRSVLARIPSGCRLLDIGIGTGSALLANSDLVIDRDLHVTGIDIDHDYIERCRETVRRAGLEGRIEPRLESVYDHRGGPYGAAYFSGSFMLLPDPAGALHHVAGLLDTNARVYFTQTFEHAPSPWLERIKPALRWLTTIDFGRVTYEEEFRRSIAAGGFAIESVHVLDEGRQRSAVLVTASPTSTENPQRHVRGSMLRSEP